jgi:SAM-dependent methyltransferase
MDVGEAAGNPMIRNALGDSFPASPEVTLRLCREAGVDEYSHVLHLGAGVGSVCQMLIEVFGCKATGVVAIEPLLQHCIYEDERVHYVHSKMSEPPFEAGTFTHVLIECRCIIQRDLEAIFSAAKQMLAPGGQLIVNEPVLLSNSSLPKVIGRMVGETRINEVVQQRTALDIGIEITTVGFEMINSQSEPEVTQRLLAKLNQISMMLKMALRFSSFDPKSEEFPFTKKDLLKAFDELKKALDDETFGWHSWRSTSN